jgi:hypothetical protein
MSIIQTINWTNNSLPDLVILRLLKLYETEKSISPSPINIVQTKHEITYLANIKSNIFSNEWLETCEGDSALACNNNKHDVR